MRRPSLRLAYLACFTLLPLAATCDGPPPEAAKDEHGHDHGHSYPISPWDPNVEMVSQKAVTYPAIDFNPRPANVPSNVIGLTFDDGPDDTNTPRVLDVLAQKNVKATFFINTNNWDGPVDSNTTLKNIIRRIKDEGHQLASHTVSHQHLPQLTTTQIHSEITGVQTTVNRSDVLGASFPKITMLRAPFGDPYISAGPGSATYDKVAPIVAQYAVHMGWAIDTFDYAHPGDPNRVYQNFVDRVNAGDYGMVLMHSVHAQTADAIGPIIDFCKSRNKVFWLGEQFVQAAFNGQTSNQVIYGTPPTCTQTPFGGSARAIPGTIQAEDYDNGGNNCAYMDTTTANQGNAYRTTEAVDVQTTTDTGGGHNIGYVQAGEYLDYTVNVTTSGSYNLELRVAATTTGKTIDVSVGGTLIADNVAVPNTGNYQTFTTVTVPNVSLAAGTRELKILFNQASQNLNWIRFTSTSPPANQYTYFEAENGTLTLPMVRVSDANASGGQVIWSGTSGSNGEVPAGGHATFTFNVPTAGTFQVWGRFLVGPATSSDDSLWARIDNGTWIQWNDIHPRVGNAGYRWDRERNTPAGNALVTRSLSAGNHTLEVAYRENGLKMDRFLVTNDLAFVPSP